MIHPQRSAIKPSATARLLYCKMISKANELKNSSEELEKLYLPLDGAISLSIDLRNDNKDPNAPKDITELLEEGWIAAHNDGGWELTCCAKP
jgi:hypothetical protein